MRNLLATLALLAIVLAVGLYAAGWLNVQRNDSSTTIELETDRIEEAAERAVEDGRDLLDDAIEQPAIEQPVIEKDPPADRPESVDELEGPITDARPARRALLV